MDTIGNPTDQPTVPKRKLRWFRPTPEILLVVLLAVEGVLLWVNWLQWLPKGWAVLIAIASVGVFLLFMLLWFVAACIFRWRFQFNIRSLLVLTVAVAVPFSWLAVAMNAAREQKAKVSLANLVDYYPFEDGPGQFLRVPMQRLLGEDFFGDPVFLDLSCRDDAGLERLQGLNELRELNLQSTNVKDAELAHLKGLSQLDDLNLDNTPVTDAGLEHLEGLSQLSVLYLSRTKITDAGLEHLQGLSQLQTLGLKHTQVTDAGLEHLKGLSQLQCLDLDNTQVSDAGLDRLKDFGQLRVLFLNHTRVTDDGVKKIRQALPKCKITNRSHPEEK